MTETVTKACSVYQVSDAIKERFKDEEDLLPSVKVQLGDHGLVTWEFQVYCLDERDVRALVDLLNEFGLKISIVQDLKEHALVIKLSTQAAAILCEKQKFDLLGKHAK